MPHVDCFVGSFGIFSSRRFVARLIEMTGNHTAFRLESFGVDIPEHGKLIFIIGVVMASVVLVGQFLPASVFLFFPRERARLLVGSL